MVPNFALDLSEDGIILMHRASAEADWQVLREIELDDPDLSAKLHDLRDLATGLSGGDFHAKLILPPSQLLYISVPVGHDVHGDVERALQERTPYAIEDLSYDLRGTAPEVQVVAVAKDTLREAEDFIAPYGLNAIGFTARPDPAHFRGEPNLGMTALGERVGFDTEQTPVPAADSLKSGNAAATETPPEADPKRQTEPAKTPEPPEDTAPKKAAAPEAKADPEETPPAPAKTEETREKDDASAPASNGAPAAFSSRRRGGDSAAEQTGERLTRLSARIAIPEKAPKLGGAVRATAGSAKPKPASGKKPDSPAKPAAQSTAKKAPPIIPAAPPALDPAPESPAKSEAPVAAATPAPAPSEPKAKSRSALTSAKTGLSKAVTAARARRAERKVRIAAAPPEPTGDPSRDPIAELAAKQAMERPRRLGIILTLILIAALGLFAALSSYLLPEEIAARLFGRSTETAEATGTPLQPGPDAEELADAEEIELAALPSEPLVPDYARPELDTTPQIVVPTPEAAMTFDDAETAYAVSGIWQKSPEMITDVTPQTLNDLYIASLDPDPGFEDAPALPRSDRINTSPGFSDPGVPPPAGLEFTLDARGLVVPTPDGAFNQDGIRVYSGPPPVAAIPRSERNAPRPVEPVPDDRLAAFRPVQRPDNLIERQERATLGGRSRSELANLRPTQRPESAQAQAEAIARAVAEAENENQTEETVEDVLAAATKLAVATSVKPSSRPRNFAGIVAAVREAQESAPAVQTASASTASTARATGPAVSRSSRAAPTGPTRASVARAATDNNALALGRVALVGVFGTTSNRRALVRMPNGRFKKVSVGDRVDGGRVAAIGSSELRYTKGGRTVTLKMPKG